MTEGGVSFVIVWGAARAPGGAASQLGLLPRSEGATRCAEHPVRAVM